MENSLFAVPDSLQDSAFLRLFLDTLPLGVLIINTEGTVIYCNDSQARMDDMPKEYIIGKAETDLYGPYVGPGIVRSCQATGTPILGFVCPYRTVKGKIVNGAYWVYPLRENGVVTAALCLMQPLATKNPMFPVQQHLTAESFSSVTTAHFTSGQEEEKEETTSGTTIVGGNAAFRRMLSMAETTASSPSPVMICGETGCGKEMVVKAIRAASNRYDKPYLAINCSAIPATLLEGILFGVVRGSYTGAVDRPGLFEEAEGGIIYLDEIDSMPLELQPKLLRVLQDMRVRRLGSSTERALNVKVISSIAGPPEEVMGKNKLRSDLFYRLAVITLRLPPLRERMDDLDDLIAHFVEKYNRILNKQVKSVDPQVHSLLHLYHWPGNVRELEHVVAGAINLVAWENQLRMHHIPDHHRFHLERMLREEAGMQPGNWQKAPTHSRALSLPASFSLAGNEEQTIAAALQETGGHVTNAAKLLGISRQLLNYKLKKYGIVRRKTGKEE